MLSGNANNGKTSSAAQLASAVAGGANSAKGAEVVGIISMLEEYRGKRVGVVLSDNRQLAGTMFSYDAYTNLLLRDVVEFIIEESESAPLENGKAEHSGPSHVVVEEPIGVLMVRGADVVAIGLIDTVEEAQSQR